MNKLFLLLLIVIIPHQGIAQKSVTEDFKYKAVYKLTYQPDSTNASSITSEEMWLYLGDKISKFSSKGKALKDSLSGATSMGAMGDFQTRAEKTRTEFDYLLFKNFPEDKITYTLDKVRNKLLYEEEEDLFEWEILPETRNIQGYESQKAKTTFKGRDYMAWFTTEIPIPDGPYKFGGLPGLIVQLSDSRNHYNFELVQFLNLEEPITYSLETGDYTSTSRNELLRIKRELEEDPFAALENANKGSTKKVTIKIDKKQKRDYLKKIREELEKKNNPIELE